MCILEKITELRKARNWTEYRLAEMADIPQSTISSWYKKDVLPSVHSLTKICGAFGITLSQFFAEPDSLTELTNQQKELLDHWNLLNAEQRDAMMLLLKSFIQH